MTILKYQRDKTLIYLMIAKPSDSTTVPESKQLFEKYFAGKKGSEFEWKRAKSSLMMSVQTRYQPTLAGWLGSDGEHFVDFKVAEFTVDKQAITIGYAFDWADSRIIGLQQRFASGEGVGDQAIGCNALVSVLNSVTREFPEKKQYCSLSTLPGPVK
ncbi:MAG: hypothetical protein JO314_00110 [Acidobacteria bacterium]|nr:hypothetical protein [Acidobacteriota bacterium]